MGGQTHDPRRWDGVVVKGTYDTYGTYVLRVHVHVLVHTRTVRSVLTSIAVPVRRSDRRTCIWGALGTWAVLDGLRGVHAGVSILWKARLWLYDLERRKGRNLGASDLSDMWMRMLTEWWIRSFP